MISVYDILGLGCRVDFDCTFVPGSRSGSGPTRNCQYNCNETGRVEVPLSPDVECTDIPSNLNIRLDVTVFLCEKCPQTTKNALIFTSSDLKSDCSRATCRDGCDAVADLALDKAKTPVAKAAIEAARAICYDACNAVCRNP